MTLRPKWSKNYRCTTAWRSRARLLIATVLLGGCSSLDPNVGPLRSETDEDVIEDAGTPDAG